MENLINLGRVSLVPKGEYDPTVQYERLDLIRYGGAVFLALRDVRGVTPTDSDDYMLWVESGTSFRIMGRYDTLESLKAAHPAGNPGDAYAVGSADSNTIYLWSADSMAWQNVGPLQGPQGERGPAGADGKDGAAGPQGPAGPGVPAGGTTGQVLAKKTGTSYDTQWIDPPSGGGSSGGVGQLMAGQTVRPTSTETVTAEICSEIFNDYRTRSFENGLAAAGNVSSGGYSHAEGLYTTASGIASHSEGGGTIASAQVSHAEGFRTKASGNQSHTEGIYTEASGLDSHAEGDSTIASGHGSHAEGMETEASGDRSHAEGDGSKAIGNYSHAQNWMTIAAARSQTAMGLFNKSSSLTTDLLIIGKGTMDEERANCFRVTYTGVYASGSYNASGADYAEMFEWADGNPDREDRVGRFVTLDGAKIRLAGPEDDYIIGIVSGNPSVVGDIHDDQWQGMYLYDIFGRPLWEDVELTDQTDQDGRVIIPAHTECRQKLNPAYDNSQTYQPRSRRPEWGTVGMLGKLVAVDDGSCQVNSWCTAGEGGVAVKSMIRTRYRVMERLDERHVRVLIL